MIPVSRRTALKAFALPVAGGLAGLGTAGCGAGGPALNVAVVWTGWELRQFQKVIDKFTSATRIRCHLLSMGDDVNAFLGNEVTSAAQPDVALVPQPGTVLSDYRRLVPQSWPSQDAQSWRGLLAGPGDAEYGVWYKASYKSMVWHTPEVTPPGNGWTWDDWAEWCKGKAGGHPRPLAIGAADGWVLADWFSNLLLARYPDTYRELAGIYHRLSLGLGTAADAGQYWNDPRVADTLRELGSLWKCPGLFPGGAERALATQFDQSVLDVFGTGEAMMVAGADFYWSTITQYTSFPRSEIAWFPFPGGSPGQNPVITAGDAAVGFSRAGGELVNWLSTPPALRIWAEQGGFLSIDSRVPSRDYTYPASMDADRLVRNVQSKDAQFNLSDLLSGSLAGSDGEGAWKIFTDFFADVAVRGADPGTAAARAVNALANGTGGA